MDRQEAQLEEIAQLIKQVKSDRKHALETSAQLRIERLWALLQAALGTALEPHELVAKGLWRLGEVESDDIHQAARDSLQTLAEAEQMHAEYRHGLLLRERAPAQLAVPWLERAAHKEHPRAPFDLGFLYMRFRQSAPEDSRLTLALQWFELAVQQHEDVEACAHLSIMYRHGLGTEPDPEKSRHYLHRALVVSDDGQSSSPRAHASYGLECLQADEPDKALRHLLIATRGDAARYDAMLNAARLLLHGRASEEALERELIPDADDAAFALLCRAASRKPPAGRFDFRSPAQYELARLQLAGRGGLPDPEAAFENMQAAAGCGYLPAMRYLLGMLEGRGLYEELATMQDRIQEAEHALRHDFSAWESDNYLERSEAHVTFSDQMAELLVEGEYGAVLARIEHLYDWARSQPRNPHARRSLRDARILYQRGQARRGLGQIQEAMQDLRDSAHERREPRHQSMCYSEMAECAETTGDFDQAAQYCYDGFLVSGYARMWIRHACALFLHNPQLRRLALRKIEAFMVRSTYWREREDELPIEFPKDEKPHETCVTYAELLWRLPVGDEPAGAVERTLGQLVFHLGRKARDERRIDERLLQALARGVHRPAVCQAVVRLIENIGLDAEAERDARNTYPFPLLAPQQGARVLRGLRDGLGRVHGYTRDIAQAVVRRIERTPDLIQRMPALGQSLAHMLWRCIVQAYYRGSPSPEAFRAEVGSLLTPLMLIFRGGDAELLRDWMFEVTSADKPAVEYALVAEFLNQTREDFLDPYTLNLRLVDDRLRTAGFDDLERLAHRLTAPESLLATRAFGDLARDTGWFASRWLGPHIQHLLHQVRLLPGVRFNVALQTTRDPDVLISTAARVDLTLLLAHLIVDDGPVNRLLRASRHIDIHGDWDGQAGLRLRLRIELGPAAWRVQGQERAELDKCLRALLNNHSRLLSEAWFERDQSSLILGLGCNLAAGDGGPMPLGKRWRDYLILLIREHAEHRQQNVAKPNHFQAMREELPALDMQGDAAALADRWALVVHAVCDRFHVFFASSLLRARAADRSPVSALHDLKKALELLRERAIRRELTEAHLVNFRLHVQALGPVAERLLKGTLAGWRIDNFDLHAELRRPAGLLEQVFGEGHDGVQVLGGRQVIIKAPKEQVLLAMRELLANAQNHAGSDPDAPFVPIRVAFEPDAVVISNPVPRERGPANLLSTGKGAIATQCLLEACGMGVSRAEIDGTHVVRIVLPNTVLLIPERSAANA